MTNREVITAATPELSFNTQITLLSKYFRIDRDLIRKYIPEVTGVRSSNCFKLLILIYDLGEVTRGYLRLELNTGEVNINNSVEHMYKLGLLSERNMGVYVPCFNKHKFNKGYSITPKGIRVLTEIFDKIKE